MVYFLLRSSSTKFRTSTDNYIDNSPSLSFIIFTTQLNYTIPLHEVPPHWTVAHIIRAW